MSTKLIQHLECHHLALAKQAVPLLFHLLNLPVPENYSQPRLLPYQKKEQAMLVLVAMLRGLAAKQPTLFIVEGLHCIDPSTLALLKLFVEQAEGGEAWLGVFTARHEFDPPWPENLETNLTHAPLTEGEVVFMVTSIVDDVNAMTLRQIIDRADG